METMEAILISYWFFLGVLLYFYGFVHHFSSYYFKDEEGEDIKPGDDDYCCPICHEDVRAFSDILRSSKCERWKLGRMEVTSEVLKLAVLMIGFPLVILLCLLWSVIYEGRDLALQYEQMKLSSHARNCICSRSGNRCPAYLEDLTALEKTLDKSKCKHIRSIFADLKHEP
ncbi:unnamed protein product [Microthlaspi erraticum]|uniref:Uncharacterized protein n=1 Tax=Microthlaspi erraticum TaxID=1685480 RepID=A0A6D2J102_9BRAS|nr:unnamed protein product [Microthlaspi erraticum]